MYLHEATIRMMTGAAPAKTQQLLDKSLIQKSSARGLICVKGNSNSLNQNTYEFRRISFCTIELSVFIIMSVYFIFQTTKSWWLRARGSMLLPSTWPASISHHSSWPLRESARECSSKPPLYWKRLETESHSKLAQS